MGFFDLNQIIKNLKRRLDFNQENQLSKGLNS